MAKNNDSKLMFNSKYSNVLTIVLIIVIIAIVGLVIFLGYDMYRKYYIEKEAEDFLSQYEEQLPETNTIGNTIATNTDPIVIENVNKIETDIPSSGSNNSSSSGSKTYKGFNVLGTIEIPKTGIKYPVLEKVTTKSLQVSVAYYYGPGLNKPGNTVIYGHNYRNGAFFGKNKQLKNGDIIYITDNAGQRVKYTIYKVYTTSETDAEYVTRDTKGAREISLSTCTDDSKARLVIWAKE